MNKYKKAKSWIKEIGEHPYWGITGIDWEAIDQLQELLDNQEIIEIQNSNLDDEIQMYKKALKNACRLAIQNNHDSYIAIHRGTREQYNLPLTYDDDFNEKILNNYLLEQARKELEDE